MSFDKLCLRDELLKAVFEEGYTKPTPIQTHAIPEILDKRDILAGAQTGTGKTAAFALPMLQLLSGQTTEERGRRYPRALVLTPTRELAVQVGESIKTYGKNLRLRSTTVYGGVGITPQIEKLRRGIDILVATPGRLLDHAGQRTVNLSRVEILVIDEADRMLDMGFIHDIRRIIKLLPATRQNLLFSATYSGDVRELAEGLLNNPRRIQVSRQNTAVETVSQIVHHVGQTRKRELLSHLIKEKNWDRVLVFTRTKFGANRLAQQLSADGVSATAIHGNKTQAARIRALSAFKSGRVQTMVATDVASRGLDIEQLPYVVNFDMPYVPEDYIHRIGRTGRAGERGTAISLVSAEERRLLTNIERLLKYKVPVEEIPGFHQKPGSSLSGKREFRSYRPRAGKNNGFKGQQSSNRRRVKRPAGASAAKGTRRP